MLTNIRHLPWLFLLFFITPAIAQDADLPPCGERPLVVLLPRVEGNLWCIEKPIDLGSELATTAITFADDGTLYAISPQRGELLAFVDSDGDSLPDQPRVVADGLRLPNGLAYADGVLYIVGDGIIYAYEDEEIRVLADDLPGGRGFFTSGIAIAEGFLYVGIPAPCDDCVPDDPLRGIVLRMALDGSEREVVARGLRYPAGLTIHQGALWVTDSASDAFENQGFYDELNVIDLQRDDVPHFGWPYCIGLENEAHLPGEFDCAEATAPTIAFATGSIPLALHSYQSNTYPFLTGDLIFVLGGSLYQNPIRGYQVGYLDVQPDGGTIVEAILPYDRVVAGVDRVPYDAQRGYDSQDVEYLNRRGAGTWPHRIFSVAESPEGYLYISVGGGTIYVLRPGDRDPCELRTCEG